MKLSKITFKSDFTPFAQTPELGRRILEAARSTARAKVYRGVTIIKSGLGNRKDKNFYPHKALKEAADKGMFEGLRAYIDHPDSVSEEILPERTVRDMAGVYTNTRYKENNGRGRVVGDFRVFKHHNWLSSMIDELMEAGLADKIGISVNGSGKTKPEKMTIAEAGPDPIDVNYVDSFVNLRSADVVTEAGAGGGWAELRESARGALRERTMKPTRKQLAELQEAAKAGNLEAIKKLTAALLEASDSSDDDEEEEAPPKKKKGKKGSDAEDKKDGGADDDMEEAATEDGEEETDPDAEAEAELDAAVESAQEGTDPEDLEDEEESDEEDLEESDEDLEESDEEESDEEEDDEVAKARKKLHEAIAKAKQNGERMKERGMGPNYHTAGGRGTATGKGKSSPDSGTRGGGGRGTGPIANQRARQGGRGFPRSTGASGVSKSRESESPLVQRLLERNARLSAALKVRSTADRARKLLRESSIPAKLQPDILPLLVGQDEETMKSRIRYHEKLVSTVISEVGGADEYEMIDGNGTRIREGNYGGGEGGMETVFEEVGLPMKAADEQDTEE